MLTTIFTRIRKYKSVEDSFWNPVKDNIGISDAQTESFIPKPNAMELNIHHKHMYIYNALIKTIFGRPLDPSTLPSTWTSNSASRIIKFFHSNGINS